MRLVPPPNLAGLRAPVLITCPWSDTTLVFCASFCPLDMIAVSTLFFVFKFLAHPC